MKIVGRGIVPRLDDCDDVVETETYRSSFFIEVFLLILI
jgi:hypothetical protein